MEGEALPLEGVARGGSHRAPIPGGPKRKRLLFDDVRALHLTYGVGCCSIILSKSLIRGLIKGFKNPSTAVFPIFSS